MDHNKETQMRTFVRNQLSDAPDLSALTLGILKQRYLSHVGCESLSPEAKTCIKRVVGEELLNMQIKDRDTSESEKASVVPSSSKRKREEEDKLSAKRICLSSSSGSAGNGTDEVELKGKSCEPGQDGSEEQACLHGVEDQQVPQGDGGKESTVDQDGAEEQMDVSDTPQNGKGPAGEKSNGKRGRKPGSGKRQAEPSSDKEKESSFSLSDEEEDKDSKKKKTAPKQKGGKRGKKTGSGKQQANPSSEDEKESSPSLSEESEEEDEDSKKKKKTTTAPGSTLIGKQKGGKGGEKTGSGKQQANPSSEDEKESSPSLSDEEEDKDSKKGNAPGDKLDGKRKGGRKPESGKQQANPSSEDEKESSPSLSDEEEDKDSKKKKKKRAPGSTLIGKQKGGKGGEKTGSGKKEANPSSEDEKESSPPQSDKESEEEDKDSKKKKTKTPGNTFDGKQKGGKGGEKTGSGKKQANPSSDEEKESSPPPSDEEEDKDPKKKHTPKQDGGNSEDADGDKAGEVPPTMKTNKDAQDSDSSSSLCSLEDEKDGDKKLTKKNRDRKKPNVEDSEKEKHGEVKVLRLKRYIALCGLKRNYKKLLEGCRSVHSKVAVLKKELEDAGIKGQPSLKKCKKVQLKIEEARDLADLDVSNIISTQGRPKRRAASPWGKPQASPAARYKRTVNSDSEDSSPTDHKPQRRTDWGNLRGIISNDEGDSD